MQKKKLCRVVVVVKNCTVEDAQAIQELINERRARWTDSSKELPAGWDPKWAKINAGEQTK